MAVDFARNLHIVRLVETCSACPSQWDAWTDDGTYIYIRYRWGWLEVDSPQIGQTIWEAQIGDEYDGVMDAGQLRRELPEWITIDVG